MGSHVQIKEGDRIQVLWDSFDEWFEGVIATHEPTRDYPYHIQYDDGDEEWVAFNSDGLLASIQSEDGFGSEFVQRKYKLVDRPVPTSTTTDAAPGGQQPVRCKRRRLSGSGKKVSRARGAMEPAVAVPHELAQSDGQAVGSRQPKEAAVHEKTGSPNKKTRIQQQQQQAPLAAEAVPLLGSGEKGRGNAATGTNPGEGLRSKSHKVKKAPTAQSTGDVLLSAAQPSIASHSMAAASIGVLTGRDSVSEVTAVAVGASPLTVSLPIPSPSSIAARDPRKTLGESGPNSVRATPVTVSPAKLPGKSAAEFSRSPCKLTPGVQEETLHREEQQPQSQSKPGRSAAQPAVTVIGFQFSTELATVNAALEGEEDEGAGGSGEGSYCTIPGTLGRSLPGGSGAFHSAAAAAASSDIGMTGVGTESVSEVLPREGAAGGSAGLPSEEEIERQVACRSFERMLAGLTRTKEAIGRATGLALQAAKCNAAPRLVRMVLEHMTAEDSNQQRVNLLYLIDSVLQTSVRARAGRTDCGPQSAAGQAYPRVVGAALTRLVEAVARDVQATEKLEKVLLIWQRKAIISDTLLQPALMLARTTRAQHDSAWDDAGLSTHPLSLDTSAAGGISSMHAAVGTAPSSASCGQHAAAKKAMPVSGAEGEAVLWRMWRRLPMNAAVLFKLVDQKTGSILLMTQHPQSNHWEDMKALREEVEARGVQLESPPHEDFPAYRSSPATSSWEDEGLGGSPSPNASPWHWATLREAKRSAAVAAAQQEQVQRAAAAAAAAAQAAQWVQLAASTKAQQAQRGSGEPDEFDQEMLQQIAGGALPSAQLAQQDLWSQVTTLEAEALYGGTSWSLPGTTASGAGGATASSSGEALQPPLPSELPSTVRSGGGGQPPLPEDDYDEGPPPLPAYSPPHDAYAPAEFGGQPPLPSEPPPDDDGDYEPMDLMGTSPEFQPPLPPGGPEDGSQPPLLPPGIGVRRMPPPPGDTAAHAAPPLPSAVPQDAFLRNTALPPQPLPTHHQPTAGPPALATAMPPPTTTTVAAALAGLRGPSPAAPRALRSWTGFVTELVHGSHGAVDSPGQDSGFFLDAVRGSLVLQLGDRVKCEAEEYPLGHGGYYQWRITSMRPATDDQKDDPFESGGHEQAPLQGHTLAHPAPAIMQQAQQAQSHSARSVAVVWHHGGSSYGNLADAALMDAPSPGFARVQGQQQQHPWGPEVAHGDYAMHPMTQSVQQQQDYHLHHQQVPAAPWNLQQRQQAPGYPPGWGGQ